MNLDHQYIAWKIKKCKWKCKNTHDDDDAMPWMECNKLLVNSTQEREWIGEE